MSGLIRVLMALVLLWPGLGWSSVWLQSVPERFFVEFAIPLLIIEPRSGQILEANPAAADFYGYSQAQLRGMSIQSINALDERDVAVERERAQREQRNYFLFPHRLAGGEIRTVEVYSWPMEGPTGETLLFSVIIDLAGKQVAERSMLEYTERLEQLAEQRYQALVATQARNENLMWLAIASLSLIIGVLIWNIVRRRRTERSLHEKTAMLEGLLNSIPDLIFFKNRQGVYLGCNTEFSRYVGRPMDEIIGSTDYRLFDLDQADSFNQTDQEVMRSLKAYRSEEWTRFPDASQHLLDKLKAPLRNARGDFIGVLGISRDITDRHQNEKRIKYLAYYDPLTNLPNRFLFQEKLEEVTQYLRQGDHLAALVIVDLDHFKNINDARGHSTGDQLLIILAHRMVRKLSSREIMARFGGDEYVLLLLEEKGGESSAEERMNQRIQALQKTLGQPVRLGESEFLLSSSLGVTYFDQHKLTFDALLKEADIALYQAKEAGRGTWRRFKPSMQTLVESRFELEGDLRRALDAQELQLYLQPKTNEKGEIYGTESLVRWVHPTKGLITPDRFIPLAEDTGMIVALGDWVLRETLRWMLAYPNLHFAVNVSPKQFHCPDFVPRIKALLNEFPVNPSLLTLEVTEGLLVADFNQYSHHMTELQALGVRFSIDDFGTGYSSLSYLKKLPINELKIDRSFVMDLPDDSSDALLVETMMAVATHLQLAVVAEGVETEAQRDFLFSVGCTLHQGYYYGKPEPAETLLTRLRA